jgi:hypothetical protein
MAELTFAQRLQYTMRVRWPLAMKRIAAWGATYAPMSAAPSGIYDAPRLFFHELDYLLGDGFNFCAASKTAVASGLEAMQLEVGQSYRLTFEAQTPKKNFTLPGDGFLDVPGFPFLMRVYKIAFRGGNLVDVDVAVVAKSADPKASTGAEGPPALAGPLIPISVIALVIAAALLTAFGALLLKEVKPILVGPSGFVIAAVAAILLIPKLRRAIAAPLKG